jgi:superfamily II DNA or RNA helicase
MELNKNSTNFPTELSNILVDLYNKNSDFIKKNLFEYQRYIYNYLVYTNARGILLYHSVGSGKTLTSISIAEEFRKLNKDIIIISSKSLQANYKKEIIKYSKLEDTNENIDEIINKYKFVTSNSKNMISSLDNKISAIIEGNVNLENKIIIIDEAHNLFNSIVNGSKIANEFYDLIMDTKKLKLIFLTGTPIINNPFEIAVAFNMLSGKLPQNGTIMPEYYSDFQKYFIDIPNNTIKNEIKFQNRIYGLVSYYGDMYTDVVKSIKDSINSTISKENYPDRLPIKINVIEMSNLQLAEYKNARDIEKKENTKMSGGSIIKEKNLVSTSYRIRSRQLSNIFIPTNKELNINNFKHYSPKFIKIFDNIVKNHKNQISLVYSNFLESGINAFSKLLELHGYTNYLTDKTNTKKYSIFSGQQTPEEKELILKTINNPDNKNGNIIEILLISKSGAEGLDLKNVRSVHIIEPYWNYSLIEQIIARAVRYKSHELLEPSDRNVQTYIYLSDYPKQYLEKEKEKIKKDKSKKKEKIEFTTDINIFKNAIKNQELIQIFLKSIAMTSIECKFLNKQNINYNCLDCIPNNKQLYHPKLEIDLELSNTCIRKTNIKANEVLINNIKYYYTNYNNEFKLYKYNEMLNGYQEIYDDDIISKIKTNLKM